MRGKVERRQRVFCGDRITPAYAGKRAKNTEKDMHTQDHPRLCGEKISARYLRFCGSRITPAYAGKRVDLGADSWQSTDHPRLCGEKSCSKTYLQGYPGSPPPMRGKGLRAFPSTST